MVIFYMVIVYRYMVHLLFNIDICDLVFTDVNSDTSNDVDATTSHECCQYYYILVDKFELTI